MFDVGKKTKNTNYRVADCNAKNAAYYLAYKLGTVKVRLLPIMTHQPSSRLEGKKGAITGPVTSSSLSSFT